MKKGPMYSEALDIAVRHLWLNGACTHYAGYLCDKDFTKEGVCEKCLRAHYLKLARKEAQRK